MKKVIGVTVPYNTPIIQTDNGIFVYKDGKPIFQVFNTIEEIVEVKEADEYEASWSRNHPLGERYILPEGQLTPKELQYLRDFEATPVYNLVWYDEDGSKWVGGIGGGVAPVFAYVLNEQEKVIPKIFWRII